ncbi:WhiB family transcriptional regulator [Streptomyces sp. NPDC051362]|uniref:WhiB family transcriptional regulator n=1 Tax=Streptomyces sp. NPDC051362 TaxID=3365651 RepID=UPI0037A9F76E
MRLSRSGRLPSPQRARPEAIHVAYIGWALKKRQSLLVEARRLDGAQDEGRAAEGSVMASARTDWRENSACGDSDADDLFADSARQKRAKMICMQCPVRTECLAEALDDRIEFGVWGGMTERERRVLLRRKPNVASWSSVLAAAQVS